MTLLHIVVLSLVQGITEFLPISSSGHLVMVPLLTDWPDQGLKMDVAVHVGTLLAVMLYFWRDLVGMVTGLVRLARGKRDAGARLAGHVVVGTLPVLAAGYAAHEWVDMEAWRTLVVIGWATLGFGLLLYIADRLCMTVRRVEHMSFADAVIIGLLQCLALVPGTSRSGITMTAARVLGFERPDAARFSMLLSMPTIAAAGLLVGLDLWQAQDLAVTQAAGLAAGLAFASALVAIWLMMAWLRRSSFAPFAVYRLVLGAGLLLIAYGLVPWPPGQP